MNKIALITGASSGIGKELAYIHAENKGDLILVARSYDKLKVIKKDIEERYSNSVHIIKKDLSLSEAPEEVYKTVRDLGLKVDYLINNAGFGGVGNFHERELAVDLAMIQLNIVSLTALTRLFLDDFTKNNEGKILNVSSTASLMPGPLQAVYFATKAYVTSFSNAVNEELKGTNISVTNLMPGATETGFAKTANMEDAGLFKNSFPARDVAEDGYNAMLSGKLDVISGVSFMQKLMLKAIPFSPKTILMKQIKAMQEVQKS